jgi:3-oxoadipate enol-lactonase
MATRFVERMCVEIDGQGEPLVMIHGLGGTSNTFTPLLTRISAQMQVFRPDLPGSGRSPTSGRPSIEEMAAVVVKAVTTLGVGRANFVGHSLGAILAFHIALRNPLLVKSLAMIGPLLAPSDAGRQGLRERATAARAQGMQAIADAIVLSSTSGATRRERPLAVAMIRETLMRQDAEGYARNCEALAEAAAPDVAPIKCPTLLVTGDEDPVATVGGMGGIARRISGSESRVINRCGHWATFERPEAITAAVEEFLGKRR